MKNKKGFTLIELLAVIVILAVIALILTPIVSGIIKTAKKNAFESTGYGILESTKLYYSKKVGDLEADLTFTCNNDTCVSDDEKLEFKGNINGSGTVLLFKDGNIALCLESSDYATLKNVNDERLSTTEQGTCEFDEETKEYSVDASVPASQYAALQAQYVSLQNEYNNLYSSLGDTDISNIGDGTITGAIDELNVNLDQLNNDVDNLFVDDGTMTLLNFTQSSMANDQTYYNRDIFEVPEGTTEVWVLMATPGSIGGWTPLLKGRPSLIFDYTLSRAGVIWTASNKIHVSYFYNSRGAAVDVGFMLLYK